ncbi:HD domain-containing protein [Acidovorax sp. JMULE5]|uniref:HD-GYP domain-containing protein n=1 Tax=Acidovorax sp. JMULE5 TaxID=2518343 RepID=UPI00159FC595|nr:HD domain-containing phosphohydrolase [Acidovorax sp. JMULE5]QLA82902.1 HD domain-containing protein [Acidovorax sp. JMULE5]
MNVVATARENTQFSPAAADQMEKIVFDLGRVYQERNEALQEVARAHHEALFLLSMAAEYKDGDTGIHIVRIGFLAEALALFLGESKDYALMLRKAAPMHDIGKIGIPDEVLKKPGAFTPQERAIMNQHSAIGADILGKSRIALFQMAAEIALAHHERWDGKGYPNQLAGPAIPLSGRIVTIVDFYDALTMDRVYRPAFSHEKALEMLLAERGKAFDPDIVDCFLRNSAAISALREQVTVGRMTFADLINRKQEAP